MQASWRVLVFAACGVACACSSSSSNGGGQGPDCTMFSACGGNIVGSWKLTKACLTNVNNPFAAMCPSSTFQVSENVSGTAQFNSDGTYSSNVDATASGSLSLPASCVPMGFSCAQLQMAFNQSSGDAGSTTMATCSNAAAGGCSCQLTIASNSAESGTYSTSGNNVTLMKSGSSPSTAQYCVQGNGLLLKSTTGGMMGMGAAETTTFAATKQ